MRPLKKALRVGVPPELAYRMVTLNVAEYFRLDHLIGSLAPGRMADIVDHSFTGGVFTPMGDDRWKDRVQRWQTNR